MSPGAVTVRPPLPGLDLPGIFQVRTVPDARAIREWIERGSLFLAGMHRYSGFQTVRPKTRAVVIGGGFIGLETAENLVHRGFDVTLVEMLDQILAPLDREMARVVEGYVERHGLRLALNDGVSGFKQAANGSLEVQTKSGKVYPADIVILSLGVRPDTALAKAAGLAIGERGGIRVDDQMRTSNPDIFAVGDAIEVRDFVTGQWSLIALAGPANRQGRIAADVIAGRDSRFRGTQGTSIIGLFGAAAAWTGASEKTLNRIGDKDFEKVYLYPNSHAGYYPGARPIAMKVLFRKSDGRLLGAQALGEDNVDKRISALAVAIQMGATIYDLEEAELCYSPQFGSAKDPVNFAGMVAADVLRGDMPISHWDEAGKGFLLDVRDSYANCGLPYHVGGVIEKESSLLCPATMFPLMFAIDVRTNCEAIRISPDKKTIDLRNVATGEVTTESYDKLVLSPGAVTVRPPLPGHRPAGDLPGQDRARREGDPRVDRARVAVPRRNGQILRLPDGEAQDAGGGHRGRVHRPRDGGEPRSSRVRRHPRRDARPGPGAARSGNGAHRGGLRGAAWHPPGAQ